MRKSAPVLIRLVAVSIGLFSLSCGGDSGGEPTPPTNAAKNGGDGQAGIVGQEVSIRPSVRVTQDGAGVAGRTVTFAVASGGGSITGGSATTDANGVATVGSWTLGTTPGANTLTATVSDAMGSPLTFTATAAAGPPAILVKVSGDAQNVKTRAAVPIPPSVRVTDEFGNVLNGVQVTFEVTAGGGSVTGAAQATANDGTATVTSWTMGPGEAENRLTATVPGAGFTGDPAVFTALAQHVLLQPGQDTVFTAGTIAVTRLVIPGGRTVTASGNIVINSDSTVLIAGTLVGNCVSISINGEQTVEITGTVNNGCAAGAVEQPLTIVAKGGYSLDGAHIISGGDVEITNNTAVSDQSAGFRGRPVPPAADLGGLVLPGACDLRDFEFTPQPQRTRDGPDGSPNGGNGSSGHEIGIFCFGNLNLFGGVKINSQSGGNGGKGTHQSAIFANATGGMGGKGGITRLIATGQVIFSGAGNSVEVGSGGDGGDAEATALNNDAPAKAPSAKATGGDGREMGALDLRGGTGITIIDPVEFLFGNAGNGGNAKATADDGHDATATEQAQEGGDADAQGGVGASSPQEVFTPPVAPVVGAEKANFMGGGAGDGGDADSRAGNGGHGNLPFPNGADGGDIRAQGAVGGTAFIKDLQNTAVGLGGTGGMATWTNGNGGNGNNRCPVTCPGGNGGMGGVATGGDGAGGNGVPPGPRGGMLLNTVARGGNAGSGFMPGVRGVKGNNAITPPAAGAGSFVDGANAVICFPAGLITMSLVSVVDPAGHNPFLKFCTAPSMSFAGGGTTMSVSFAGSPGGIGPFGASGIVTPAPMTLMGTAMFSGTVPVTVTILGVSATGEVTFTVQIGGPTAPMGHPLQVPIIYTKKFQLPQACPTGAAPSPQPDNNAEVSALRWLSSTAARWSDAMFAGVREGARLMR